MSLNAFTSPDADVSIAAPLIRALLQEQFPEAAHLPIHIVEAGWDNVMARLGDDLAVRLPRRALGEPRIRAEQLWLPYLASRISIAIPELIKVGVPCALYPFHWSVQRWLPGEAGDLSPPADSEALVLAKFLKQLHALPLPDGLKPNPNRSHPLSDRKDSVADIMISLRGETDIVTPAVEAVWEAALAAPIDLPPTWIAGDIHARNVLVQDGKISAFIDWGDQCPGDPATDLSSIWSLFDTASARRQVETLYDMSEPTITRAKGWAVFYGLFLTVTGRKDTPRHAKMGEAILRRISEDSPIKG